jgi:DNA-binding HxlR family transcriptional regulator
MNDSQDAPGEEDPARLSEQQCYCPTEGVINILSRRYAIQVICVVGMLQPVQYSTIENAFEEVSSSTLSTRLRELTEAELLHREQFDTIPPQVEYELTADGGELCDLLEPLVQWAEGRNAITG